MPEFSYPIDVCNRALQHVGADRLVDRTLGFSEISKPARQVRQCYGGIRRAELRKKTWKFATRRATLYPVTTSTMLLAPTIWSSVATYTVGMIVDDGSGTLWQSRIPNNLNLQPTSASGAPSSAWELYFGSMTVELYSTSSTYQAGDLVYTASGDGTYRVYRSLINANSDNPATATAWSSTTTYMKNQTVTYSSTAYASLIDLNLNQTPSSSPAAWASGTTYALNATVSGSDGVIYTSLGNGNVGHDPTTTGGVYWSAGGLCPWTTTIPAGSGSLNWRAIGGIDFAAGVALAELGTITQWPLGAGTVSQSSTLNLYRLPAGFLRKATQNPHAGAISALGFPGNDVADDRTIEGDYIISSENAPLVFRFVADVQDVTKFDDVFCEGLAAKIAEEICQPLTNSTAKVADCRVAYERAMGAAKAIDAIEDGWESPDLDDFIACRA